MMARMDVDAGDDDESQWLHELIHYNRYVAWLHDHAFNVTFPKGQDAFPSVKLHARLKAASSDAQRRQELLPQDSDPFGD